MTTPSDPPAGTPVPQEESLPEEAGDSPSELPGFESFELTPPLLRALRDVGYERPSPIQAAAIPPLLQGRDLIGVAQTGTGKTAAFVLPLLRSLDLDRAEPQVLVLTPTRELALQVCEATRTYGRYLEGLRTLPVYGGQGMELQLKQLRRGVHFVVGTPGRVQDHLRRRTLRLDGLTAVVLDEADEMLRMGFLEEVTEILEQAPPERQTALFSATMPGPIRKVAGQYLKDPEEIRIRSRTTTVASVRQRYWQVRRVSKLDALCRVLESEPFDGVLVFARTKNATAELAEKLEARGYGAAALNGDMGQALRERTVERLRAGRIDVLVATDVAARGLDVPRISHVVNYDIPYDVESYVHRIGRTGRAGRTGEAILFVQHRERRLLHAIEKATRQRIEPMDLPTRADVSERRVERFKEDVAAVLEAGHLEPFVELVKKIEEEQGIGLEPLAAALLRMAQKERPLDLGARDAERAPAFDAADLPPGGERLDLFRLEVGRRQGVLPRHLVATLTNQAGLEPRHVGRIDIRNDFSLVQLPGGMPRELLRYLAGVEVLGKELGIRRADPREIESFEEERNRSHRARSSRPGGDRGPGRRGRTHFHRGGHHKRFGPTRKSPRRK